jgi:hypothetical protein
MTAICPKTVVAHVPILDRVLGDIVAADHDTRRHGGGGAAERDGLSTLWIVKLAKQSVLRINPSGSAVRSRGVEVAGFIASEAAIPARRRKPFLTGTVASARRSCRWIFPSRLVTSFSQNFAA